MSRRIRFFRFRSDVEDCVEIRFGRVRVDVDGLSEGRKEGRKAVAALRPELKHRALCSRTGEPGTDSVTDALVLLTSRSESMKRQTRMEVML